MGLLAFSISVIAGILSLFKATRLPAFVVAIFAIIFAMVATYQNSKKSSADEGKQDSRAFEVGSVINSGAVCLSYLILLWL